jgi:hypothetical protein
MQIMSPTTMSLALGAIAACQAAYLALFLAKERSRRRELEKRADDTDAWIQRAEGRIQEMESAMKTISAR